MNEISNAGGATCPTLNELASSLHLNRNWLRSEALAGRIPSLRVGRRLFNLKAVRAELAQRAARTRQAPVQVTASRTMQVALLSNADPVEAPAVGPGLLYSAANLAEIFRVSKPTIWRLRAASKLPRRLDALGQQLLSWDADEIHHWIAAKMLDLETW